jgi:hypothetical protein
MKPSLGHGARTLRWKGETFWSGCWNPTISSAQSNRSDAKRGVDRQLAWNTVKSVHGPWRPSQSPALAIALPPRYFAALGLPSLFEDPGTESAEPPYT